MKDFIKKTLLIAIAALVVINFKAILGGIGVLLQIIAPLLTGAVMAFILNIFVSRLERIFLPKSRSRVVAAVRRPVCILLSLVIILAIFTGIIRIVVPELGRSFALIGKAIPETTQKALVWLDENAANYPELEQYLKELQDSWPDMVNQASEYIRNGFGGLFSSVIGVVGAVTSGIVNFVVGFIFCIYILANKERLTDQFNRILQAYVPRTKADRIGYVLRTVNDCFASFIVGQCLEAIIIGVLCAIGMGIFGFPYAGMIGTVIGATALIPMLGAYIGAAVGAFLILTVNPIQSLLFLVFIIVLQQVEGNLIYPRVVGSSIGLPGIWVLAAVTIGGAMGGIMGMLVGVPAAASAYRLLANDVNQRNSGYRKKQKEDGKRVELPQVVEKEQHPCNAPASNNKPKKRKTDVRNGKK